MNLFGLSFLLGAAAHHCSVAVLKNQKEPLVEISVTFVNFEIGVLKKFAIFSL